MRTTPCFAQAGNPGGYPVGSIQCLINVDASTTNNDPTACRSTGWASASPTRRRSITSSAIPIATRRSSRPSFGANLSFTPFATWAGDVSVAVGAEYREGEDPRLRAARVPADRSRQRGDDNALVGRQLSADQRQLQREGSLSRDGRAARLRPRVQRRRPRHRLFDFRLCHDLEGRRDLAADRRHPLPRHALARYPGAQPQRAVSRPAQRTAIQSAPTPGFPDQVRAASAIPIPSRTSAR